MQNGRELDLDTIKDKLGPGAKVTATDANGETKQVSIPRPVEPEEPVIPGGVFFLFGGGSSAPSAPTSPSPAWDYHRQGRPAYLYTSTQSGNTLTVCVGSRPLPHPRWAASVGAAGRSGIETITFHVLPSLHHPLSVDELLAMGGRTPSCPDPPALD